MKSRFLTFAMICLSLVSIAQIHPILESFDIRQVGNEVEFRFGIKGGASCSGVDLERSFEPDNFEIVGVIPGVCGGSPETEFYDIRDEMPESGRTMYYRLRLGAQGWTDPIPFDFVPVDDEGINVFPNPSDEQLHVRIDNPGVKIWSISAFLASGELWREYTGLTGVQVEINVSSWPAGIYFLRVVEGERAWVRRVVIN